ncbi:MAG TPA: hypothetical protein VGA04_27410 [Streptosporangiaceae bacterium]
MNGTVIVILVLVAIVELLVIAGMAADKKEQRDELARLRNELRELQRDDGRFVDQLMERGRQEVERLEAYYRRNLSPHERPTDFGGHRER